MIPKFRCFDKDAKTMHEVVAIDFRDWRVYYEAYGLRNYWNKNVVLMQSTGLHDNTKFEDLSEEEQKEWLESGKTADEWQGREIFEGDLIHYTYRGFDWYVPVVYEEGRFEVYHGTLSTIPASKIPSGKYATNIGNSISVYRVEFTDMYVAGNIYENPELLEVEE